MKPILDRVIIKQDEKKDATKGGIILPDASKKELPSGEVIAVGPDVKTVEPGYRVLFNVNWKQLFSSGSEEYVIINEPDILCIIDKEQEIEQDKERK